MRDVLASRSSRSGSRSRDKQRERLVDCAEAAIAKEGLVGLRARDLAGRVGCSVGGIYNLVADLDELVLLVGQRTMALLDAALDAAESPGASALDQLLAWARAYAAFAALHRERWHALFQVRMEPRRDRSDGFAVDQMRIVAHIERCLASLLPEIGADALTARACTLFAAVHGIVSLGIDETLVGLPAAALDAELVAFVSAYVEGLAGRD